MTIPNKAPSPRRERRAIEREERRSLRPARQRAGRAPAWRSPIALFTLAALAVGLGIVIYSILQQPSAATIDDLRAPAVSIPANLADGRTLGSAAAPVTIEIWSDFQCPGCRSFAQRIEPSVISEFVIPGSARLVYRDAAFQGRRAGGSYDESVEAAAAARCAVDDGKFWVMHDWIFANWNGENEGAFRADRLRAIAAAAGLDLDSYDSCMASGQMQTAAISETNDGVAAGVNSTPTLFINGAIYQGGLSVPEVAQAIRDALPAPSPAGS